MALILFRISKISIIILSQKLLIIYMIFLEQEIGLKFFFLQLNNKSVMAANWSHIRNHFRNDDTSLDD